MNDFIVQGDARAKRLTLTRDVSITFPGGTATIPAGTVIDGILEYRDPVLDNNPTANNKANLLADNTAAHIWGENAPDVPTVNLALLNLAQTKGSAISTFELIQRGLI